MKKSFVLLFLLFTSVKGYDNIYYLSAGFSLGLNLSKEVFIDGKLSISNVSFGELRPYYITTLTAGFNSIVGNNSDNQLFDEYNYFLLQLGSNTFNEPEFQHREYFISGIGIGGMFSNGNLEDFSPMMRLYSGAFIFPELDIIAYRLENIKANYGLRVAIPLLAVIDQTFFGD